MPAKTATRAFGAGARNGHDASAFYGRALYPQHGKATKDSGINSVDDALLDFVITGDARNMRQIPDGSVGLAITSPPYNCGKDYDQDLTLDEYRGLLREVMQEVWRVLEPGGRVAINLANVGRKPYIPLVSYLNIDMDGLGFLHRGEIIWVKGNAGGCAWGSWQSATNPTLRDAHEYVCVYSKGEFRRQRKGVSTISKDEFLEYTQSIWKIAPESARRVGHPAPFPIELPRRLIQLYSYSGDVILDPFAGSGTTGVAAIQSGRRFIGYDTDAGYATAANRRLQEAMQ